LLPQANLDQRPCGEDRDCGSAAAEHRLAMVDVAVKRRGQDDALRRNLPHGYAHRR